MGKLTPGWLAAWSLEDEEEQSWLKVPVVQGLVVQVTGVTGLGRLAAQRGLVSRTEDQVPSLAGTGFICEEIYEFYKRARPAILPTFILSLALFILLLVTHVTTYRVVRRGARPGRYSRFTGGGFPS